MYLSARQQLIKLNWSEPKQRREVKFEVFKQTSLQIGNKYEDLECKCVSVISPLQFIALAQT